MSPEPALWLDDGSAADDELAGLDATGALLEGVVAPAELLLGPDEALDKAGPAFAPLSGEVVDERFDGSDDAALADEEVSEGLPLWLDEGALDEAGALEAGVAVAPGEEGLAEPDDVDEVEDGLDEAGALEAGAAEVLPDAVFAEPDDVLDEVDEDGLDAAGVLEAGAAVVPGDEGLAEPDDVLDKVDDVEDELDEA